MNPLCIYHNNCYDGFASAWVMRRKFGSNVDLHPANYGDPLPPDVVGRDVVLTDFSYRRDVMDRLIEVASSVLVLDHHKTARASLDHLPGVHVQYDDFIGMKAHGAIFDMNRSGSGITWDYFFFDQKRPPLIDMVEDRDLWRFELPLSRDFHAGLSSYPFDFALWDKLVEMDPLEICREGKVVERKHWTDITNILATTRRTMVIGGIEVHVANVPPTMTSDAGNTMAADAPFAACYWDTPEGRVFSLRSLPGREDVSEVAKRYGGGGHANASGFRMPLGWEGDPR